MFNATPQTTAVADSAPREAHVCAEPTRASANRFDVVAEWTTPPSEAASLPAVSQQQQQPQQQPVVLAGWRTGLFECDKYIPSSLDAFLCPHCMSSSHFRLLYQGDVDVDELPRWCSCGRRDVRTDQTTSTSGGATGPSSSPTGTVPSPTIVVGGLRQVFVDVLVAFCCTPCVVAQHHRELTAQGNWPGAIVFSRDPPMEVEDAQLVTPGLTITR